ncbi:MAG: alkaline phosphatase D family protein [Pseudomonadota bacterium]
MSDHDREEELRIWTPTRRGFVKSLAAAGGIVIAPAFMQTARGDLRATSLFPLGVASGDPKSDSVVLWTRVVEDPITGQGLGNKNVPLGWEVATDPGMRNIVQAGRVTARARNGHAVRVIARRLPANAWLYYRFYTLGKYSGHQSRIGRTRTFPSPSQTGIPAQGPYAARTDSMRFAFVSCQNYTQGFYPAWRDIAQQDIDFVVHTGDYMYESGASSNPLLPTRNHTGGETFTLDDYRNRYALYRLDQDLQDAHAHAPFIVTWDDHEVDNNYAGTIAEEGAPFIDADFLERRKNAYEVYGETMPVRRTRSRDGSFPLARRLQFGRLADIHVLDSRQFRDDQAAADGFGSNDTSIDPQVAALLESVFGEVIFDAAGIQAQERTLLGFDQEYWLGRNLASSKAQWNVLAQQVMVMPWDLRTTGRLNVQFGPDFPGKDEVLTAIDSLEDLISMDAWDGYGASRDRLFEVLDRARPGNPVVLTGDIHSGWGAELLKDFGDPENSDVLAAEFVCTSIASTFAGADPRPIDAIVRAGIPDNPHIKYFDGRFRGYSLCDVSATRWRTEYRAVGSPENLLNPDPLALVPQTGDPVFTAAVAEIESGFNSPGERKPLQVSNNLPG